MTKPATKDTAAKATKPSNTLEIESTPGADQAALLVRNVLRPSVRAAVTTRDFSKMFGELDINTLVNELAAQAKSVNNGELQRPEAMLIAQAHTLEAIFHELARRAALNMGEYIGAAETYMRLALKAQSQCRTTLETLSVIKNPPAVAFVRQANIANGPQQVNNAAPRSPGDPSRARESENPPNKQLEQQRDEGLDTRATQATVGADPPMAPVGEVHGPHDWNGQG